MNIKKIIKEEIEKVNIIEFVNNSKLYHGTEKNFEKFDLKYFNQGSVDGGWLGKGIYLTNDFEYAESYGNVLECKVNIRNPFILTDEIYQRRPDKLKNELKVNTASDVTHLLVNKGHDSIILTYQDSGLQFVEICVFKVDTVNIIRTITDEDEIDYLKGY